MELIQLINYCINCCNTSLLSRIFGIGFKSGLDWPWDLEAWGFLDLPLLVTPEFPETCKEEDCMYMKMRIIIISTSHLVKKIFSEKLIHLKEITKVCGYQEL
jgi:hypothetical protein